MIQVEASARRIVVAITVAMTARRMMVPNTVLVDQVPSTRAPVPIQVVDLARRRDMVIAAPIHGEANMVRASTEPR